MTRAVNLADVATAFDGSNSFLRNRIINGGMEIAQRATTATGTYNSVFVYASVDRWAVYSPNSSTTQAQSTDAPTGFRNSFKLQRPSSNTGTGNLTVIQGIESVNCYDLSGQTVTLSFWAKRGANYSGGAISVYFRTGTTADQGVATVDSWAGISNPINTSQAITTTWTRYTFTGTLGSGVLEAAVQIAWTPSGTAGADDSVYITGVQLEAGSVATPFERRQYGQELMLCQRYYEKSYDTSVTPGTSTTVGMVMVATNSTTRVNQGCAVSFGVEKRATPTVTYYDCAGNVSKGSAFDSSGNRTDNNTQAAPTYAIGTRSITWRASNGVADASAIAYQYVASAEI